MRSSACVADWRGAGRECQSQGGWGLGAMQGPDPKPPAGQPHTLATLTAGMLDESRLCSPPAAGCAPGKGGVVEGAVHSAATQAVVKSRRGVPGTAGAAAADKGTALAAEAGRAGGWASEASRLATGDSGRQSREDSPLERCTSWSPGLSCMGTVLAAPP